MSCEEIPLRFECRGALLFGILARPQGACHTTGIVIVVGGPQYRVGSHRQFVLLARAFADAGFPCLRFDYRGMGDSGGDPITFDIAQPDIEAAVASLRANVPSVASVVLFGLCDGATACTFAAQQSGAAAMALVNPWARSQTTSAEATLRHYYGTRVTSAEFWRKLVHRKVNFFAAIADLWSVLARAAQSRVQRADIDNDLADRIARCLAAHPCPTLVVLSGRDQTAAEFRLAANRPGALRKALERASATFVEVADADHTFSTARWRAHLSSTIIDWLRRRSIVAIARSDERGVQ